jgi:hypothetical protein
MQTRSAQMCCTVWSERLHPAIGGVEMPHNECNNEISLSFQQILELLGHSQKEESPAVLEAPSSQPVDNRPSREVVLKVIEGLKQV